jgi:hypothetical protein
MIKAGLTLPFLVSFLVSALSIPLVLANSSPRALLKVQKKALPQGWWLGHFGLPHFVWSCTARFLAMLKDP